MPDIIGARNARRPEDGAHESRQSYDEWLASGQPFDANAEKLGE